MMFEIKVLEGERFEPCNHCRRGDLKKDGYGIDYPYKKTYQIQIGSMIVVVCDDCRKDLLKELDALCEGGEK